jgi:hypothetical protein
MRTLLSFALTLLFWPAAAHASGMPFVTQFSSCYAYLGSPVCDLDPNDETVANPRAVHERMTWGLTAAQGIGVENRTGHGIMITSVAVSHTDTVNHRAEFCAYRLSVLPNGHQRPLTGIFSVNGGMRPRDSEVGCHRMPFTPGFSYKALSWNRGGTQLTGMLLEPGEAMTVGINGIGSATWNVAIQFAYDTGGQYVWNGPYDPDSEWAGDYAQPCEGDADGATALGPNNGWLQNKTGHDLRVGGATIYATISPSDGWAVDLACIWIFDESRTTALWHDCNGALTTNGETYTIAKPPLLARNNWMLVTAVSYCPTGSPASHHFFDYHAYTWLYRDGPIETSQSAAGVGMPAGNSGPARSAPTSLPVAVESSADIEVSSDDTTAAVTVIAEPVELSQTTVSMDGVNGGPLVTSTTITVPAAAPAAAQVAFTSSAAAVTLPSSLTMPDGTTAATTSPVELRDDVGLVSWLPEDEPVDGGGPAPVGDDRAGPGPW